MRKIGFTAVVAVTLFAGACAQDNEGEESVPADTATMAPAPAPMPMDPGMQMDSAAHDTMMMPQTTTQ